MNGFQSCSNLITEIQLVTPQIAWDENLISGRKILSFLFRFLFIFQQREQNKNSNQISIWVFLLSWFAAISFIQFEFTLMTGFNHDNCSDGSFVCTRQFVKNVLSELVARAFTRRRCIFRFYFYLSKQKRKLKVNEKKKVRSCIFRLDKNIYVYLCKQNGKKVKWKRL